MKFAALFLAFVLSAAAHAAIDCKLAATNHEFTAEEVSTICKDATNAYPAYCAAVMIELAYSRELALSLCPTSVDYHPVYCALTARRDGKSEFFISVNCRP